jgi:hypothetical protein
MSEILPEFNGRQSTSLLMNMTQDDRDDDNLNYQSLIGNDETSTSDCSSNTLNDSSLDTTPHSSRVFQSIENQLMNKTCPSASLPVDKRLTNDVISLFKTTSTPVTKSTSKSETKLDVNEHTSSIMIDIFRLTCARVFY